MKDKKQKICFDKRYLLLLVAGFLTGRVWLYGINPFGVALFAAVAAERKGRKLLALFVLAGMFSSTEGLSLIKYLTLFLLVLSLEKIQEKWTSHTGQAVYLALLTGGLNMAAGIFEQYSCRKYMGKYSGSVSLRVSWYLRLPMCINGVCILFCMKSGINYLTMRN